MKRLELKPSGFSCKLNDCPPGLFLCSGDQVGLKTEYGPSEAYCESGESFWGDANKGGKAGDTVVTPLEVVWVDEECE